MTKNIKTKKAGSYKRMGLIMLCSAAGGGVLGLLTAIILDGGRLDSVEAGAAFVLAGIQQAMVPLLTIIMVISVIYGEYNLRKQRMIGENILRTEDEECDRWEYEEEKAGAYGTVVNLLSMGLCVLVLSAGYSMNYINNDNNLNMLTACLVFLACYVYDGFWQMRYVKVIQKTHPEKKGDPSSLKFQQQWLDSCDEAEREVIYRSAYRSYIQTNRVIMVLLVLTMLGHLFFNTGIMAIVVVIAVWLVSTVSYLRSCVSLKGQKIRE